MAVATVQVNIRLEPQLYAQVKREAQKSKRTVTAVIAEALAVQLDRGEKTK
jgi:hypothetical protein